MSHLRVFLQVVILNDAKSIDPQVTLTKASEKFHGILNYHGNDTLQSSQSPFLLQFEKVSFRRFKCVHSTLDVTQSDVFRWATGLYPNEPRFGNIDQYQFEISVTEMTVMLFVA